MRYNLIRVSSLVTFGKRHTLSSNLLSCRRSRLLHSQPHQQVFKKFDKYKTQSRKSNSKGHRPYAACRCT